MDNCFKNMPQLKRFGLYFELIPNKKLLLSQRNYDISYRDASTPRIFGACSDATQGNTEKIDVVWYVLMYYLD